MSKHTQYKPGDTANGHVLGADGQWYPQRDAFAPPPKRKKPFLARWYMLAAYVVVAIFIAVNLSSGGGGSTTAADSSGTAEGKPVKAMKVTAKKILADFESNEASADAKYQGKTLAVSGVVDKVDTDIFDGEKYIVRVSNGQPFEILTVNCNDLSASEVESVQKGADITVTGEFDDGGDLGVELKGCAL